MEPGRARPTTQQLTLKTRNPAARGCDGSRIFRPRSRVAAGTTIRRRSGAVAATLPDRVAGLGRLTTIRMLNSVEVLTPAHSGTSWLNGDRAPPLRVGRSRALLLPPDSWYLPRAADGRRACLKMPALQNFSLVLCLEGVYSPANRPATSTLTRITPSPDDCLHGPRREATRSTKT